MDERVEGDAVAATRRPSGRPRIAAPSGGTDDYATALLALVAALAGKDSRGHVRFGPRHEGTYVGRCASTRLVQSADGAETVS